MHEIAPFDTTMRPECVRRVVRKCGRGSSPSTTALDSSETDATGNDSTAVPRSPRSRCVYTFAVNIGVLCLMARCATCSDTPAFASMVPKVWRKLCTSTTRPAPSCFGIPAAFKSRSKTRVTVYRRPDFAAFAPSQRSHGACLLKQPRGSAGCLAHSFRRAPALPSTYHSRPANPSKIPPKCPAPVKA